jgi:quercetin dioxygenase-like cupin family protein
MRYLCVLVCFAWLSISLAAQVRGNSLNVHPPTRTSVSGPIEMKSDHNFHQVLDNEHVRIFKVEVPPLHSTETDYHRHDYVVLSLGTSNFEISGGGISYPMQMQDGEMQVLKGGTHQVVNRAETSLRLIELEVLRNIHPERPVCGLVGRECTDGTFGKTDEGTYSQSTLFETDTLKLARVQLGPGGALPQHHHSSCHVLLALDDVVLSDQQIGEPGKEVRLKTGEALWYPAGVVHRLKNLDRQEVRLITVDFK